MLFHPMKVPLKAFSVLSKILSSFCAMILLSLQYFQVIDIANIDKRVWTEVKIEIVIVDFWEFLSAIYQKESE